MSTESTEIVCDFCSGTPVTSRFKCPDFEVIPGALGSKGDWAACDTCTPLIRARDADGILNRSLATYPAWMQEPSKPFLRSLHAEFWRRNAELS